MIQGVLVDRLAPKFTTFDLTVSLYALGNDQGKREDTATGERIKKLCELGWTTDASWFEPVARPTYISSRERWWCPFTKAFCFTVTLTLLLCTSPPVSFLMQRKCLSLDSDLVLLFSGGWWDLELRTTAAGFSVQWKQRWQSDPQTVMVIPQNTSFLPVWWQNIWGFNGAGS